MTGMRNILLPALAILLSAVCGCASTGGHSKVALIVDSCSTNKQIIVSRGMVDAVSMAGFLPLILPKLANTNQMDEMVARADALVVFGSIKGETDERYRFERYMVRKAAARPRRFMTARPISSGGSTSEKTTSMPSSSSSRST